MARNKNNQTKTTETPLQKKLRKGSPMVVKQHDMIFRLTKIDGVNIVEFYYQDELQEVFDYLLEQHGELFLKVNWFSEDLLLAYPDKSPSGLPA